MPMDTISLRNFHMAAVIGHDAWNRPGILQPIVLTLKLLIDTTSAGTSDEIGQTFSYGQMCKDATVLSGAHFRSVDELTTNLVRIAFEKNWPGESLQISLVAPKALLRVEGGLGREVTLRKQWIESGAPTQQIWICARHVWQVRELKVACIIGVNPHERLEKQQVAINLEILGEHGRDEGDYKEQNGEGKGPWATLVSRVCSVAESSEFQTLEALAALIARTCLEDFPIPQITVLVEKPSALTFVEGAGVEITRDRSFLTH